MARSRSHKYGLRAAVFGDREAPEAAGTSSRGASAGSRLFRPALAVQFAPVAGENFQKNLALVDGVREIAREKGVKPSELALAWVLAQGEEIVPIPGTAHRDHLEENTAALGTVLSHEDLRRIDTVAPQKSRRRRALHRGGHVPCERVRLPTSPVMRRLKSVVMGTVPPWPQSPIEFPGPPAARARHE